MSNRHKGLVNDRPGDDRLQEERRPGHLRARNDSVHRHVIAAHGDRIGVRPNITVITGERAEQWEIRQAAAVKEVLLWQYRQRHPIGGPHRGAAEVERPAA